MTFTANILLEPTKPLEFAPITDGAKTTIEMVGEVVSDLNLFKSSGKESYSFQFMPQTPAVWEEIFNHKLAGRNLYGYKFINFMKNGVMTLRPKKYDEAWLFQGSIPRNGDMICLTLKPSLYMNTEEKTYGVFFTIYKIDHI